MKDMNNLSADEYYDISLLDVEGKILDNRIRWDLAETVDTIFENWSFMNKEQRKWLAFIKACGFHNLYKEEERRIKKLVDLSNILELLATTLGKVELQREKDWTIQTGRMQENQEQKKVTYY